MIVVAGGAHPGTIIRYCPPKEVWDVMMRGLALLGSCSFTGFSLYTAATTVLNEGHFSASVLLASMGIGAFIGVIDNLALYRGTTYALGVAELHNTGVSISTPTSYTDLSGRIVRLRIAQGVVLGLLLGVFTILSANNSSIAVRSDLDFMTSNKLVASETSKQYDAQIVRATEAVAAQQGTVTTLSKQISSLRQRMITPQKRAAGVTGVAPNAATFDKDLIAANALLDSLKAE